MGEGHVPQFIRNLQAKLIGWMSLLVIMLLTISWGLQTYTPLGSLLVILVTALAGLILALVFGLIVGKVISQPTAYLAQAILHISPSEHLTAAPNLDELKFGRELINSLVRQVYDFATVAKQHDSADASTASSMFDQFPVAVLGLNEQGAITLANRQAVETIKLESLIGQPFESTLQLLTESETSIETWLKESSEKSLTGSKTWQKVEVRTINGNSLGYFDIAISFSKHSGSGIDTVISLYDHSDVYEQEESEISFIAMAVHELRSPLTIMRGYIEAFEEELGPQTTPQLKDDLRKMTASAENLTAFVSTILNVARIDEGLALNLREENWNMVLAQIVDSVRNRAAVYGKTIELRMQPDMPSAAIERITIGEVVTNLLDNAIKYTPDSPATITVISQVNKDGLIETTIQDTGVGIPASVMPRLFNKFQRNHRNRAQIRGTGLGLYVSKAIMTAHQGNIWASSKEGEGSTFGFTLLPYSQLAKEQQTNNNEAIIRSSHGWIKNHSMQRH